MTGRMRKASIARDSRLIRQKVRQDKKKGGCLSLLIENPCNLSKEAFEPGNKIERKSQKTEPILLRFYTSKLGDKIAQKMHMQKRKASRLCALFFRKPLQSFD